MVISIHFLQMLTSRNASILSFSFQKNTKLSEGSCYSFSNKKLYKKVFLFKFLSKISFSTSLHLCHFERINKNRIERKRMLLITFAYKGRTSFFLGARFFGRAILLAVRSGTQKNEFLKPKRTSDLDTTRHIAFCSVLPK